MVGIAYLFLFFLASAQLAGHLNKPRWKPGLWCFVLLLGIFALEIIVDGINQRNLGKFLLIISGNFFLS
ncbi:hypothetical protein [Streptococcus merionis]|uniref:hypothetical protein n=1 Tax=Streptococcus merionis TaxID=400065 RepID=UPI0003A532C5|nr:hypothetical protein [Streptococcus merionis]